MSESIKFELISRRGAFSLLGLAAAASVVVPATMLIATGADAQTQGMERRDERRSKKKKKKEMSGSETEKK